MPAAIRMCYGKRAASRMAEAPKIQDGNARLAPLVAKVAPGGHAGRL
jgi:hypothetical protein